MRLPANQLSEQELDELASYNPTLTYGQSKQAPPQDFIPAHVAWDKKVNHIPDARPMSTMFFSDKCKCYKCYCFDFLMVNKHL